MDGTRQLAASDKCADLFCSMCSLAYRSGFLQCSSPERAAAVVRAAALRHIRLAERGVWPLQRHLRHRCGALGRQLLVSVVLGTWMFACFMSRRYFLLFACLTFRTSKVESIVACMLQVMIPGSGIDYDERQVPSDCAGYEYARTQCMSEQLQAPVATSLCDAAAQPTELRLCNRQPCAQPIYQYSAWGACNAACGGGTARRNATCMSAGGTLASSATLCDDIDLEPLEQPCNTGACVTHGWVASNWTACPECGGARSRSVTCQCALICLRCE